MLNHIGQATVERNQDPAVVLRLGEQTLSRVRQAATTLARLLATLREAGHDVAFARDEQLVSAVATM